MLERLLRFLRAKQAAHPTRGPERTEATRDERKPPIESQGENQETDLLDLSSLAEYPIEQRLYRTATDSEEQDQVVELVFEHFRQTRERLPAFPTLANEMFAIVEKPDVDARQLTKLLTQDPFVAGQVLQIANSALYRRGNEIESIHDAVVRLGTKEVARVAAQASTRAIFDLEERTSLSQFDDFWSSMWRHSTISSLAATWLAMQTKGANPDRAFISGLLHDVGKPVALRSLSQLIMSAKLEDPLSRTFIARALEAAHVDVGLEIAHTWCFPNFVTEACEEHHEREIPNDPEHRDLHIVRVVSGLNEMRSNPDYRDDLEVEVLSSMSALKIDPFQARTLRTQIKELAKSVARSEEGHASA